MDDWNISFLLGWPIFGCDLLVSGSVSHDWRQRPGNASYGSWLVSFWKHFPNENPNFNRRWILVDRPEDPTPPCPQEGVNFFRVEGWTFLFWVGLKMMFCFFFHTSFWWCLNKETFRHSSHTLSFPYRFHVFGWTLRSFPIDFTTFWMSIFYLKKPCRKLTWQATIQKMYFLYWKWWFSSQTCEFSGV